MSTGWYFWWKPLAATVVAHVFMAAFTTRELIEHPQLSKSWKGMWLAFTWLVPVVGPALMSRTLGYGPASGKFEHGEHLGFVGDDDPGQHTGTDHVDHESDHSHSHHDGGDFGGGGDGHY